MSRLKRFLQDEDGATAMEYVLIAALVGLVALLGIQSFGDAMTEMYVGSDGSLNGAISNAGND